MQSHPILDVLFRRASIRAYTDQVPSDDLIETVVRAGQQAPFAYQLGTVLLSRDREQHPFHAPLQFIVCVDAHRHESVMARRGWTLIQNDLSLLLFGLQDASYMAQNMVTAAEGLGMGSCYLGMIPYTAEKIVRQYALPPRVFPMVGLTMGYPAESPPPRPRYPLEASFGDGRYPDLDDAQIERAMAEMDQGYLAQDYYRNNLAMIPLQGSREETFTYDTYSWTEHISRKAGQWFASPDALLEQFARRGFHIPGYTPQEPPQNGKELKRN